MPACTMGSSISNRAIVAMRGMMARVARRLRDERGFTLIELLVVSIIIGLLAAIAYAVFLGQQTKAHDAQAKDAVSTLRVHVQSCFEEADTFASCTTAADIDDPSVQLDTGVTPASDCSADPGPSDSYSPDPQPGMVAVMAASSDCYMLEATSGDGHLFWILLRPGDSVTRGCVPPGQGGCSTTSDPSVGDWG
jgi:prepilin-type N-terminal cleavage/methylation domain-containing protein